MGEPAIRFDNVSKRFLIRRERPRSFQELVLNLLRLKGNGPKEEFWGLENVSFEIAPGETVGVIGPNGAGKSTVLKLIARIIEPTKGQVEAHGKVGALLELGAGFHPDLTGRENIYLNGSVLGLSRAQIRRKMDEIVAFSELERFIDVPVKRYSSGMYMRLGFSVAVHTEPEILLVDEVLAVGDAAFQRKCLERTSQLWQEGVTILLVSHDLDAVRRLCQRTVWLEKGRVVADGTAESVVQQYMWRSYKDGPAAVMETQRNRWGTQEVEIEHVRLVDAKGQTRQAFATGEPLIVEIHYQAHCRMERPVFGLAIHRADGVHVTGPNTRFAGFEIPEVEGRGVIRYTIPNLWLLEGIYYLSVSSHNWEDTEMFDYHDRLYPFHICPCDGERYGMMTLQGSWSWNGERGEGTY